MADIPFLQIVSQQDLTNEVDFAIQEAKRFYTALKEGAAEIRSAKTTSGILAGAATANGGANDVAAITAQAKAKTEEAKANLLNAKALTEEAKAQKLKTDATTAGTKAQKDLTVEEAKAQILRKQAVSDTRDQARATLGLTGEYEKLKQVTKDTTAAAVELQAKARINPALQTEADALSKKANDFNDAIKKIDASVGNYQKNVGNYNAAAQKVVDAIDLEKKKIQELEATKIRVQNAGAAPFQPTQQVNRTTITGFAGGNSSAPIAGGNATTASIDAEIAQSRTRVEGFSRELTALTNTSKLNNFTAALSILKSRYDEVTAEINKNTAAGKGNDNETKQLISEQAKLHLFVNQQQQGFLSLNRELLTTTKQLQELADANLQNTAEYKELNAIVIEQTRRLRELRNDQALLASEAPKLQALTIAARGLAGAYAAGSGAIALFGDQEGKLSEKLNQLVGIQTLLQGLTEFSEFLTKKSAITTALFGEAEAVATANVKSNTEALKDNAEAQQVVEGATVETTTAIDAESASTKAAAESTDLFTEALEFLEANPIVLLLSAVAIVLIALIANMDSVQEETIKAAKAQTEFSDAINETTEAIRGQTDVYNENTDALKKNLEQQLAVAEKQGTSQQNVFALRKSILDLEQKENDQLVKNQATQHINLEQTKKDLDAQQTALIALDKKKEDLSGAKKAGFNTVDANGNFTTENTTARIARQLGGTESGSTTSIDDALKDIEKTKTAVQSAVQSLSKTYADAQKIKDDTENIANQKEQLAAERRKFNADEERKQILADAQLKYDAVKFNNARILADTETSLEKRLQIIRDNADAEIQLRSVQDQQIQKDPTKSRADKKISTEQFNDFSAQTTQSATDQQVEERKQDAAKLLALQQQINAAIVTMDSKLQEEIFKNDAKSFAERTIALGQFNLDQQTLIQNAATQELEAKGLFDEIALEGDKTKQAERLAIETETANKLLELTKNTAKEQRQIIIDSNNKLTQDIDRVGETDLVNTEARDFAKSKNNKQFERQKKIDEDNAKNAKLQNDLEGAQNQANDRSSTATDKTRADGADKVTDIQNQITANDTQTKVDKRSKKEAEDEAKTKALEDLSLKGIETLQKAEDERHERNIKNIELEMAKRQQASEEAKTAINDSSLNAIDKSLAIQKIDKNLAADKAAQTKKENQEKVKEAETDKAVSIAKILLNTYEGATKAYAQLGPLGGVAGAALVIAEGALELTAAEAVKIPSYAEGTDWHPGGTMRVGEAGLEYVKQPDGKEYLVDQETFINAPAGTVVKPLYGDEVQEYMNSVGIRKNNIAAMHNSNMIMTDRLVSELGRHGKRIERAVSRIPVSHTSFSKDIRSSDYIKKVVKGRP